MSSLVRHHPGQRRGEPHSKNSLTDFDLCQIKPLLFPHEPFPFILGFHKSRQHLQRIADDCRWTHVLGCANPEFGRWLKHPDLKQWARETLPTLQQHLQMAQAVDSKIKGGKAASGSSGGSR